MNAITWWDSKAGKCDSASQLRTTCVCSSVPVTMLPTALKAAVWTLTSLCDSNGISLGTIPDSITIWIWSLPPSVK